MPIYDLTGWTRVSVTGADAATFLQNFCTNDLLKALSPGGTGGCEAFFTSEKARVLGHGWLLKQDDGVQFVGTPGQGPGLIAHLSKYALMEDVEFADRTGDPLSYAPAPPPPGEMAGFVEGNLTAAGTFSFPDRPTGEPLDEETRVGFKLPLVGVDVTDAHLCMEVDRPWAISYTKGCYLGQEPIARVRALGRVNKLFRFLTLADTEPPPPADPAAENAVVSITTYDGQWMLGYVKRQFAEPGTLVREPADDRRWLEVVA